MMHKDILEAYPAMTFKERLRAVSGFAVALGLVFSASVYSSNEKPEQANNEEKRKSDFNKSAKPAEAPKAKAITYHVTRDNDKYVISFR